MAFILITLCNGLFDSIKSLASINGFLIAFWRKPSQKLHRIENLLVISFDDDPRTNARTQRARSK